MECSPCRLLLHCHWSRAVGWWGPDARDDQQHSQAASHRQGPGEEEEDSEDDLDSGDLVHGLLAPLPHLLHSGVLCSK